MPFSFNPEFRFDQGLRDFFDYPKVSEYSLYTNEPAAMTEYGQRWLAQKAAAPPQSEFAGKGMDFLADTGFERGAMGGYTNADEAQEEMARRTARQMLSDPRGSTAPFARQAMQAYGAEPNPLLLQLRQQREQQQPGMWGAGGPLLQQIQRGIGGSY